MAGLGTIFWRFCMAVLLVLGGLLLLLTGGYFVEPLPGGSGALGLGEHPDFPCPLDGIVVVRPIGDVGPAFVVEPGAGGVGSVGNGVLLVGCGLCLKHSRPFFVCVKHKLMNKTKNS